MPQYLNQEQVYLMKKRRYFNYKKKDHIIYDCLRKRKITIILDNVTEYSNNNGKDWLFLKLWTKTYLFVHYSCIRPYFVKVVLLSSIH